jgi:hypothetical protein
MVTMITASFVEFCKIIFCVNLIPISKCMSIGNRSIQFVRIENDCVRARWDTYKGTAARLNHAPGSGHGYEITPGIEHISIPENRGLIE